MPMPAYMWLQDDSGSEVKGSVTIAGREGSVEVLAFDHEVSTPTDQHTGRVTGTRKHDAVRVVKAFDSSSPYLYKAVCEGQTYKQIKISWFQIDETGSETEYFTHVLEGCKVCSVKPIMHNVKDPSKERYVHLEEVQFRYEKITWTYVDGNLEHSDSWVEGR